VLLVSCWFYCNLYYLPSLWHWQHALSQWLLAPLRQYDLHSSWLNLSQLHVQHWETQKEFVLRSSSLIFCPEVQDMSSQTHIPISRCLGRIFAPSEMFMVCKMPNDAKSMAWIFIFWTIYIDAKILGTLYKLQRAIHLSRLRMLPWFTSTLICECKVLIPKANWWLFAAHSFQRQFCDWLDLNLELLYSLGQSILNSS